MEHIKLTTHGLTCKAHRSAEWETIDLKNSKIARSTGSITNSVRCHRSEGLAPLQWQPVESSQRRFHVNNNFQYKFCKFLLLSIKINQALLRVSSKMAHKPCHVVLSAWCGESSSWQKSRLARSKKAPLKKAGTRGSSA